MTAEQKRWLDSHPNYHVVGTPGGLVRYMRTGVLYPDGTFVQGAKATSADGSFRVGMRDIAQPGQIATPR